MAYRYEELARDFVRIPVDVYGVYRTKMEAGGIYSGHVDRPTANCGMVIALGGEAEFVFGGEERYPLAAGKVLLGGYGKQLQVNVGDSGFEYCLAHYLPVSLDQEQEGVRRMTEVALLEVEVDPELLRLQEQLLHAASAIDHLGMLEKRALFYQLIGKLLRAERRQLNKESFAMIEDAAEHIRTCYMEPLSLSELAERYGLKPKYFSHLFHKYMGIGPIDYLIQYRMNRAHEWLLTGQFTVSEVARGVGYADPYYFSRLFKKHNGLPPSKIGFPAKAK